jgi:hypothetical protein
MNRCCFLFLFFFGLVVTTQAALEQIAPPESFRHLSVSPTGRWIGYERDDNKGLFFSTLNGSKSIHLASGQGSALSLSWSKDGDTAAFKWLQTLPDGRISQTPVLFHLSDNTLETLSQPLSFCGIPSIASNGRMAFARHDTLVVLDRDGMLLYRYPLPHRVNQTPLSPDGRRVIYNDAQGRLWILALQTGERQPLSDSHSAGFFDPKWSPDGHYIVATRLDGKLVLFDSEGRSTSLGSGEHPSWKPDGTALVYSRPVIEHESRLVDRDLMVFSLQDRQSRRIDVGGRHPDYPVFVSNQQVLTADHQSDRLVRLEGTWNQTLQVRSFSDVRPARATDQETPRLLREPASLPSTPADAVYFDIPYLHQAYDVPDWFNGSWACGGTSAVMVLAHYEKLDPWPVNATWPKPHTSLYGRYVCEQYTINGYTFDIGGTDPYGRIGYGAYGFIIQNNWADTKGNMARYFQKHSVYSSVDWYPNIGKLVREVDKEMPFVLLNSLTSAGHYISVIGYDHGGTTVIVNDPWGNKNISYPSQDGRRARYDWPGYNNGYRSLNTVHCFIYARADASDLTARLTTEIDTVALGDTLNCSAEVFNLGNQITQAAEGVFVLSRNNFFESGDWILGSFSIPALADSDTIHISQQLVLSDSLISSRYFLGVYVDTSHVNTEVTHSNNFAMSAVAVVGYPNVYRFKPFRDETISTSRPEIGAYFTDRFADIDTATVRLSVDGNDVTATTDVTDHNVFYQPETPLQSGDHSVSLQVGTTKGFIATHNWAFHINAPTDVDHRVTESPRSWKLTRNYPNPFNNHTRLSIECTHVEEGVLAVYNIKGQRIKTLFAGVLTAGSHSFSWDGRSESGHVQPSGVYIYRWTSSTRVESRRMLMLK